MVPKDFRKGQCILAGWFTLLVGILWEIIAIYTIGVFNCAWDYVGIQNGVTVWNMLYITYFMGGCSDASSAQAIGFVFTPPSKAAANLQIWMWIYLAITAVWIAASIILLAAAMGEVRGRAGAILYYPWLCTTSVLTVLDLASTIYHLVDLFKSLDVESYAQLTDDTDWITLTQNTSTDGITPWLPSLYITLICCRFLVIWVANCFFVYNVCKASNAVSLYKTKQLQQSLMTHEKKTWRDKFYQGPEPGQVDRHVIPKPELLHRSDTTESQLARSLPRSPVSQPGQDLVMREESTQQRQDHHHPQYIVDPFGIPIEEVDPSDPREISYSESEGYLPRTPYQPDQVFNYEQQARQDDAPPIASGVQVPPELNNFQPFSYMAGDQPQQLRRSSFRNLSRSNSRVEYPHIPRPDYTVAERKADRRSASLEFIPNRFKLPQQKSFLPSQSSFNDSLPSSPRSPTTPRKVAPPPPRKPQPYPKVSRAPEEDTTTPYLVHLPHQNMPGQPPTYHNRETSQGGSNYNINKLY